jgi:D-alanyl-D-alanine carboxypeptidase
MFSCREYDSIDGLNDTLQSWETIANPYTAVVAARVNGDLVFREVVEGTALSIGTSDPARLRFPIYSITKTITAVCALRLHEMGKLDLDAQVASWFPDLPLHRSITLKHLLCHRSGIPDYGDVEDYHDAVCTHPYAPWTASQILEVTLNRGSRFDPGNGWAYSNTGYMLLRQILESVCAGSFREVVRNLVTVPLGLTDTFIAERMEDWSGCVPGFGREVHPHGELLDVRNRYHFGWVAPGVAISTVEDTTQFFDALFAGKILKESSLQMMLTLTRVPGEHPPAVTPSYGMGLMADPDAPAGASYGHNGEGPGYSLSSIVIPNARIGRLSVAVFCNSSDGAEPVQIAGSFIARNASRPMWH